MAIWELGRRSEAICRSGVSGRASGSLSRFGGFGAALGFSVRGLRFDGVRRWKRAGGESG